jgi:hypothetical protein
MPNSVRFHAAPDPALLLRMQAQCERLGFELVPITDELAADAARMGYTVRRLDQLAEPPTAAAPPPQDRPGDTPVRRWVGQLPTSDLHSPRATTSASKTGGHGRLELDSVVDIDSDDDIVGVDGADLVGTVPPVATVAHQEGHPPVAPTLLQTLPSDALPHSDPTIQTTLAIQPGSRGEPTDDGASVTATATSTAPLALRNLLSPIVTDEIKALSPCQREFCRMQCWATFDIQTKNALCTDEALATAYARTHGLVTFGVCRKCGNAGHVRLKDKTKDGKETYLCAFMSRDDNAGRNQCRCVASVIGPYRPHGCKHGIGALVAAVRALSNYANANIIRETVAPHYNTYTAIFERIFAAVLLDYNLKEPRDIGWAHIQVDEVCFRRPQLDPGRG